MDASGRRAGPLTVLLGSVSGLVVQSVRSPSHDALPRSHTQAKSPRLVEGCFCPKGTTSYASGFDVCVDLCGRLPAKGCSSSLGLRPAPTCWGCAHGAVLTGPVSFLPRLRGARQLAQRGRPTPLVLGLDAPTSPAFWEVGWAGMRTWDPWRLQ